RYFLGEKLQCKQGPHIARLGKATSPWDEVVFAFVLGEGDTATSPEPRRLSAAQRLIQANATMKRGAGNQRQKCCRPQGNTSVRWSDSCLVLAYAGGDRERAFQRSAPLHHSALPARTPYLGQS